MKLVALYVLAALASAALTWVVLRWLRRAQVLDRPNERSSHVVPTPRGGGWAILLVTLPVWLWLEPSSWPVLLGALGLALVSWRDDRGDVGPGIRFGAQVVAVALAFLVIPETSRLFPALPLWLDRAITALGWLWLINLTNFMDGIDGLIGGSFAVLGATLAGALLRVFEPTRALEAALLGGAALGFTLWNWRPAKLFLGDVGSVPMGFLLGWLLLTLAGQGYRIAALLFLFYLGWDATLTLLRRAAHGATPWHAHRDHLYQRAVQAGLSHGRVAGAAIAVQLALGLCGIWAITMPIPALLVASALALALLGWMATRGRAR
jgi:UDP-N-acetylmuramyl pentapeptide phosphotransferase/UDP-N-acetylglucosamine-1-phosphate transferase